MRMESNFENPSFVTALQWQIIVSKHVSSLICINFNWWNSKLVLFSVRFKIVFFPEIRTTLIDF